MIGKVIDNSATFGGLVDYLDRELKHARIIAHEGVCIINRDTIVASFKTQVEESRSRCSKPVGHLALSWHANDTGRLTDELMAQVAREYLDKMGIRNTQFFIARHFDTNHPHCHILYNRVDNDGHTISDSNIRYRNVAVCRELNEKYRFTLGKKGDRKNVNPSKLRGKALANYQMREKVMNARHHSESWREFKDNLEKLGIKMMFRYSKDGGIKGITFTDGERSFGGGKLDPMLTLKALDKDFYGVFAAANYCKSATVESAKVSEMPSATASNTSRAHHLPEAMPVTQLPTFNEQSPASDGSTTDWMLVSLDVALELIMQPHVVQTVGGGGGNRKDNDWGEREKDKYQPYRRRR